MLTNPQTQRYVNLALNAVGILPTRPGDVLFVDSNNGRDRNGGATPFEAFATLQAAINKCTSGRGDIIIVQEGHAESLASAAALAFNKTHVKVIGLGRGSRRPTFSLTTAIGASVDISAAGNLLKNLRFVPTFDAITAMMNITAADTCLEDVEIQHASATAQSVLGILTTLAADRLVMKRCRLWGTADAGTAAAMRLVGGDDHLIEECEFVGNYTTTLGGIDNVTTLSLRPRVIGCRFSNKTASAAVAMTWVATSTPFFMNNRMHVLTGTAPIVAAAGENGGGNYYKAAVGVAAATLL